MSQAPSSTSGEAPQMACTVTNNLILPTHPSTSAQTGWNGEIVAISNTSVITMEDSMDNAQFPAATDFVLLSFGTEDNTGNSAANPPGNPLPVGKTARLTLPVNTAPPNASNNSLPYDVLFAQANNYFPVATLAGDATSHAPADIVLPFSAPLDSSSGANAFRFLQAIMVDPCSPMAQQFTEALLADINTNPVTGSCANVNAFFEQTKEFKNVDFSIYSAVSSYTSAYAFVWADFQPHFTYTVYTTTTTDSADDGDPNDFNVKFIPLGTVVFSQLQSRTPPLGDANAGYSITWKPNEGMAVDLTFVEGQLVSPADGDGNVVCLQTAFTDRQAIIGRASDANSACQALIGLINGVHVVGSPLQLDPSDPDDGDQGGDTVPINLASDSKSIMKITLGVFIIIICMVILLACIVYLYKTRNANSVTASKKATAAERIRRRRELRLKAAGVDVEEQNQSFQFDDAPADGEFKYSPLNILEYDEWGQKNIDLWAKAWNQQRQLGEQAIEEANQAAIGMNRVIAAEVNQTNIDRRRFRDINLQSPGANQSLDTLQRNIDSNQAAIVNENKALKLNSPRQNQLANNIRDQQQEEQEEEKQYNDQNEQGDSKTLDDF